MAKKSTNTECKPCRSGWLFPKPLTSTINGQLYGQ